MKTTLEHEGDQITIETDENSISVVAHKDDDVVEEFTLPVGEGGDESQNLPDGEEGDEDIQGFDEFSGEEDDFEGEEGDTDEESDEDDEDLDAEESDEDAEESDEDAEEAPEEEEVKLESFQSFLNKKTKKRK